MEANPAANNNASLTLDSNSKPNARRRAVAVEEKKSRLYVLTEGVRRRAVVVEEKKSRLYVLTEGVNEDKMIVNGKDLSHTNRGEFERSKDLLRLKKVSFASSTISPRHKRAIPKRRKAKWQTVLSILTKNFLLLVALLWLGQTVWRLTGRIGDNTKSPFLALDYEGQVSEIEASLKKKANMLQVQVDAVDRKIGNELGIMARELRKQIEEKVAMLEELKKLKVKTHGSQIRELGKQIEEKVAMLEKELKKLEVRTDGSQARELRKQIEEKVAKLEELKKLEVKTDGLDKSLTEFKVMDLLSKEEFKIFRDELARKLDGSDSDVHLDQIMSFARDIVKKEIERHAADGLGRVDYALASGGARVVSHSEPHGFQEVNSWLHAFIIRNGVHPSAHKMLEPSYGEPGQCFSLQGSSGFVEIRLRTGIIPEAITLEHVSKSVAYDRSNAPKDCRVSAWFESDDDDDPSSQAKVYRLSEFSYDLEKSNAQTFNVETGHELGVVVNKVRLDFTSNHGSSGHTCIYRFRVHGYEPSSLAAISSNLMAL